MNKLIQIFEQNSLSNNTLTDIYGIPSHEHFDCVFVAPSWTIDKVFDNDKVKPEQIFFSRDAKTFKIQHNGKNYLFITLYIGAPVMIDFCLSCYKANCDKFVFIGSTGALVSEINVGDVIVPDYAISGNGATLYLHEKLNPKNMFEQIHSNPESNKHIREICQAQGIKTLNVPVISMDSVMAEYLHLDEFRKFGAKVVEMEVATFFGCMKLINKKAAAVLVVSDNSTMGQHLIGMTAEDKANYHAGRKRIQNILLNI